MVSGKNMLIKTKYFESNRSEMLRFITNKPKTSLEVGCREATHSKLLKSKLNIQETWGIEPEKNDKMINKAKGNLDYFINDYLTEDTDSLPKNYFDLVIFNDVLEHMYDPWEILLQTKPLLTENAIIIASIPNIRHKSILKKLLFNDEFEYKEEGLLDVTHIRFFTKHSIEKMFNDTGYEIIQIESLVKEKPRLLKKIFNILTFNKFKTLNIFQYGVTAKKGVNETSSN